MVAELRIRVSDKLKENLEESAKSKGLSLTSYVRMRLTELEKNERREEKKSN